MVRRIQNDIWSFWKKGHFIVIPTNGSVKKNGENVMGAGLALQAKNMFPELPTLLGCAINRFGNACICVDKLRIIAFPTKRKWRENSSFQLIEKSCAELVRIVKANKIPTPVYIPKVGCGHGNLDWKFVEPILDKILDDRFVIVSKGISIDEAVRQLNIKLGVENEAN